MSKVTATQFTHNHWGECVKVSNEEIEFVMTVEVGPRIIRLAKVGGPNELFEDIKEEACTQTDEYTQFWNSPEWLNMGGHRFWHSPEDMPRTYIPNDLPIEYEILENGVIVSVNINKLGVKNVMTAVMSDKGDITIKHYATNIGQWAIELAPWCITVFEHGGLEIIPTAQKDTGCLSNRSLIIWPYSDVNDTRFNMDNKYIYMTTSNEINCGKSEAFKIGINNEDGFAMYFNNDNLFVKKFDYIEGATYPDNGCNFESYTNHKIMEIESLGPLTKLNPGETIKYVEKWNLYCGVDRPKTSEDVNKMVEKYIK